ncbi:MAG: hypothetical protein WD960_07090 [Gemmatimonadota bacterium]
MRIFTPSFPAAPFILGTLFGAVPLTGQDAASYPLPSVGVEQVGTLPVGSLLTREASYFDLADASLRFSPDEGGYRLSVLPASFVDEIGTPLGDTADVPSEPLSGTLRDQPMARSWEVEIPFEFPFAGSRWTSLWVNSTGTLSFGRPDAETNGERGGWADGTVRAVAAAIDVRSAVGEELLIAPLWSIYGSLPHENAIHVRSSGDELVVTWNTVRRRIPNAGYDPLGSNVFQAVLTEDGEITFHYRQTPEQDGVVGVFPGGFGEFQPLDRAEDPNGDADGEVDILSAEVAEAGTAFRFSLELAARVPDRLGEGSASYDFTLSMGDADCSLSLRVDDDGRSSRTDCAGAPPRTAGHRVSGRRVDLFVSKIALDDPADLTWRAEASRSSPEDEGADEAEEGVTPDAIGDASGRRVRSAFPAPGGYDLGAGEASGRGNLFEVFNYPAIAKGHARVAARVHEVYAPEDDFVSVFTDFRVDDLFDHGPSTGQVNDPALGIGRDEPRDPTPFRSEQLKVMHAPIFLGHRFSEHVSDDHYEYRNYAFAVGWISHELLHRWSAFVQVQHPDLDDPNALVGGAHWSGALHNPSVTPVSGIYSDDAYTETSPMGGNVWIDHGDGTVTREMKTYMPPQGVSALDLYTMGLIPPEDVPETFVLVDQEPLEEEGRVRARKVPVRVEDIIAGSGVRVPPAHEAQREFRMGVYLLHEEDRAPDPGFLRQSADIAAEMARYWSAATGGRMSVWVGTPSRVVSN